MKIDLKSPAAKILIGISIVLGVIAIFKGGYKTGQWLKNSKDTSTVKNATAQ